MIVSLLPLRGRTKLEVEGMFALKENPGAGLCVVRGCKKRHIPEARGGKLHLCARHYQQRWRTLNPKQAAYATLRDHARGRKIPFTLTLKCFIRLTDAAGYWDRDAEHFKDQLSIDRKDVRLGYTDSNVQVITVSENAAKSHRERFLSPFVRSILAKQRGASEEAWKMDEGKHWLDDDSEPF